MFRVFVCILVGCAIQVFSHINVVCFIFVSSCRYNSVIQSWQFAFNWEQGVNFQVRDVRARVLTDMAWVTMKTYVDDMETGPFNISNIFEFHNGRWHMVHHHSSVMDGGVEPQIVHG